MNYIAYNTTLDLKTLVTDKKQQLQNDRTEKAAAREANIKKLLPLVLKYIHYMVELNNNDDMVINTNKHRNTRLMRYTGEKLDLQQTIERYTSDHFFDTIGGKWECNLFVPQTVVSRVIIWLPMNPYFYGNGACMYASANATNYYNTIEDFVKETIPQWLSYSRG